jgi:hypothetical protein
MPSRVTEAARQRVTPELSTAIEISTASYRKCARMGRMSRRFFWKDRVTR